jgi:hypothetical protein
MLSRGRFLPSSTERGGRSQRLKEKDISLAQGSVQLVDLFTQLVVLGVDVSGRIEGGAICRYV